MTRCRGSGSPMLRSKEDFLRSTRGRARWYRRAGVFGYGKRPSGEIMAHVVRR
jgi:hypothetical protein